MFREHVNVVRPEWLGDRWFDASWHNDACPHATLYLTADESNAAPVVEFWVNYSDPDERELGPLYMVVFQKSYEVESGGDVLLYDGEDEAQAQIWERAARSAKSVIADITADPRLMACTSFSQLHDVCDANMLGDMGTALFEEGKAHRVASDNPEVSANGWVVEVANAAIAIVEAWMKGRK